MSYNLIIPAAGLGSRLKGKTKAIPKIMLEINGLTIFEYQLNSIKNIKSITDIHFVIGYKKEILIEYIKNLNLNYNIHFHFNAEYHHTGCSYSLLKAIAKIDTGFIYLNSDLIVSPSVIDSLCSSKRENLIYLRDLNNTEETILQKVEEKDGRVLRMDLKLTPPYNAEAIGPVKLSNNTRKELICLYDSLVPNVQRKIPCYSLFGCFAINGNLHGKYIDNNKWIEINTNTDYQKAKYICTEII